jgi:hypothetical protein
MNDWRITAKRVTKYDPVLRQEDGRYASDDWTSYHDIGLAFNDKTFELSAYLEIERRYIKAILMFCGALDCNRLIVGELEKSTGDGLTADDQILYENLTDGYEVESENIDKLVQLILREYLWCELRCNTDGENSIHFGYDYYMYFSGGGLDRKFWDEIEKLGLFVE